MGSAFSHRKLGDLFYVYHLEQQDPNDDENYVNREARSLALLQAVERLGDDAKADAIVMEIANDALRQDRVRQRHPGLLASLALDGLEWGADRLLPTDAATVRIAPEIAALQSELQRRGMNIAARHYEQAVENYTDNNFEACNGQLRSFLEDLLSQAARMKGKRQTVSPDGALEHLRRERILDNEEWNIFRALWAASQDNGPHAGLTDEDEARFRLHTATASARYLLRKLR